MKFLLLALLSLAPFISLALAQEEVIEEPIIEPPEGPSTISQDFLVQLQLNISEAKIPNYLVGLIYNHAVEKGISSQAVLDLYRAKTISLVSTQNILQLLSIPQAQVFSINGLNYTLGIFNWTFSNFYNTITSRLNLTGTPLRNALVALQIDVAQFSQGITWGDPDPWQEFIKGNFVQANVELACTEAGITLETLWTGIKDLFIDNLITFQINDLVQLLLNHGIDQQRALLIWNEVPVTLDHVYSLPLFNIIIGDFRAIINSQIALGVLTSQQEAVIHRSNYDLFREEKEFLDIQAQTILSRTSLTVISINDITYRNLVVLKHSSPSNLTVINVAQANANLTNCSYVTIQNSSALLTVNVPYAIFYNETYEIPRSVVENVVSGSALVCNNTVYGLVRGIGDGDAIIIADAFSEYVAPSPPGPSSGDKLLANNVLGLLLFILFWRF